MISIGKFADMKTLAILTDQACMTHEPTDAEVLSALRYALNDEEDKHHVREISYDQFQIDGGDE